MKKYVKPDVLFEDFEMSVGVAACTYIIFGSDGQVKWYDDTDAGIQYLIEEGNFGSSCREPITKNNVYGYFGQEEGEIFGS